MNKDIKSKGKAILKRYSFLYRIYYYLMSLLINALKVFVKSDDKLILFVSFGGRRCTDSPKAMYDFMLKDARFADYKLVWGFIEPGKYPEIKHKVKIDTLDYFITSLKARCWITNVLIERGLNYKGKNTFYLYTGHGSPIKKAGRDEHNKGHFKSASKSHFDASLAQSVFEKEIRSRVLDIPIDNVYITGAPTNDILTAKDDNYRKLLRKQLGIPEGRTAILYAPTFREYRNYGTFDMAEVDFSKWHELLGNDYVILYRAHPIAMTDSKNNSDWFIDVTQHESIEQLMIASDILVSDYSGLITDYSIMHKPIYLWTFDYEKYQEARGLYFDIRRALPYAEKEEDLINLITDGFTHEQKEQVVDFQKLYATRYGSGTKNAIDLLFKEIQS